LNKNIGPIGSSQVMIKIQLLGTSYKSNDLNMKELLLPLVLFLTFAVSAHTTKKTAASPPAGKPNIVITWGDDLGQSNVSAYTHGLMGYQTPNIDRVAKAGVTFTHMHLRTQAKPESKLQAGRWQSEYHDAIIDHDKNVDTILDMIEKLGSAITQSLWTVLTMVPMKTPGPMLEPLPSGVRKTPTGKEPSVFRL
jgi:hypothetical protein